MTIQTQCTNRREMVAAMAAHLGTEARYLYAPTCAYAVGAFTVNRDSSITCADENVSELAELVPFLWEAGLITRETVAAMQQEENETMLAPGETDAAADESPVDLEADTEASETSDPVFQPGEVETDTEAGKPPVDLEAGTEVYDISAPVPQMSENDTEEPGTEADTISVVIHNHGLEAHGADNLLRTLYSRQHLLRAMMESDTIHVDDELVTRLQDERPETLEKVISILRDCQRVGLVEGVDLTREDFTLRFAKGPSHPERKTFSGILMDRMVEKARTARHVNVRVKTAEEEEMKYTSRNWLLQLGLGGAENAALRHAMLGHLKGYAAFRKAEKMAEHTARYAEIRRQKRAAAAANDNSEEVTANEPE